MWTTDLLPKDHILFKSSRRNVFREIIKSKESFLLFTYSDQKIGEKDCCLTTLARHLENQNGEGGPVCGSLYLGCSRLQTLSGFIWRPIYRMYHSVCWFVRGRVKWFYTSFWNVDIGCHEQDVLGAQQQTQCTVYTSLLIDLGRPVEQRC